MLISNSDQLQNISSNMQSVDIVIHTITFNNVYLVVWTVAIIVLL